MGYVITRPVSKTGAPFPACETTQFGDEFFPMEYSRDGDQVSWLPDQEYDEDDNDAEQLEHCAGGARADAKVLAVRNQTERLLSWLAKTHAPLPGYGAMVIIQSNPKVLPSAAEAEKILKAQDLGHGQFDDFDAGVVLGRLAALAWLSGEEWDARLTSPWTDADSEIEQAHYGRWTASEEFIFSIDAEGRVLAERAPAEGRPLAKPFALCRSVSEVGDAYAEVRAKVRWNRQMCHILDVEYGEAEYGHYDIAVAEVERVEAKYGRENLGWDDFNLGVLKGRYSALQWYGGMDWDDSFTT